MLLLAIGALLVLQELWILRDLGGGSDAIELGWRLLFPAALLGLAAACGGRIGWLIAGLGGVGAAILLVGDRASLDFFGRPLDFQQSSATGQLWQIRDSIASLVGLDGLLHLLAALALPLLGYLLHRRRPAKPSRRQRWLGIGLLLTGLVGLGTAWATVPAGIRPQTSVRDRGALVHHLLRVRDLWSVATAAPTALPAGEPRRSIETILARKARLNRTPSPFFGLAKGRNVILLQLEAFEQFLLDLEVPGGQVTPHLNRLAAGGLRFQGALNLAMGGRSSDAVFQVCTGLLPHPTHAVALDFWDQDWTSLPATLRADGYRTLSLSPFKIEFWNCARAHRRYGFEDMRFQGSYRPGPMVGWGLGDESFFTQAAAMLAAVPEPYLALHKSLSSHHPFNEVPTELAAWPVGPIASSMLANYLRLTHYTDGAIGAFLAGLRQSGQLQNSIIIAYGDHNAGFSRQARTALSKLVGQDRRHRESDRVLFVLAIPGKEDFIRAHREEFSAGPVGLHDVGPTVLHLLGLPSPVGTYGTHLFVPPAQRDPLLLPDGNTCLHHGALQPLATAAKALNKQQLHRLRIQPEVAGLLIESHGQKLVRALSDADDAKLAAAASRPCWFEDSTAPTASHATSLETFPVLGVPSGQFAQSIRDPVLTDGIPPQYIAHGGGIVAGLRRTNSLEALDASAAAGYRLIEIDVSFTADGEAVLLPDWPSARRSLLAVDAGDAGDEPLTLAEFRASASRHGLTHLTLAALIPWLEAHPGIRIVLAPGTDPLRALRHLAQHHPRHRDRFIPQLGRPVEYRSARDLGFARIILRLTAQPDAALVEFAATEPLYAVAMPVAVAENSELPNRLGARHVFTYAFSCDYRVKWRQLRAKGIDGVYTDGLGLGRDEGAALPDLPVWETTRSGPRALGCMITPHVPPGRFVWEHGPELELRNTGATPRTVQLEIRDDLSRPVGSHQIPVAANGAVRVWLRQLFPGEGGRLRLTGGLTDGRVTVDARLFWGIDDRSRTELLVATHAHTRLLFGGPTDGLGGYSLTIINPFDTKATITLTRTVDGERQQRQLTIPARGREAQAWPVEPGQRQVSVVVAGDPVVTQTQRWDPQLRVMR